MANPPSYSPADEGYDSPQSFDVSGLWRTLIEKAWVVVLCLIAAGFITYGYLKRAPVIYAATVTLAVEEPQKILSGLQDGQREDSDRPEDLKTILETLKSRSVIERVIASNHLATDVRLVDPRDTNTLSPMKLAARVADLVAPRLRSGTRLIDITVQHSHAALTEQIANSLAREFLQRRFEQQLSASDNTTVFFKSKEEELIQTLKGLEQQVQDYKNSHKGVSEEEQADLTKRITDLNQRASAATLNFQALERDLSRMISLKQNVPVLLNMPVVTADPSVSQAMIQVFTQENAFALIKRDKKPKHPDYEKAQAQLAALELQLTNAVLKVVSTYETKLQSARAEESELKTSLVTLESKRRDMESVTGEYNILLNKLKFNRELYERIVKDRRVAEVTRLIDKDPVHIEQRAILPERPIKPNRKQVMVVGLLAGLMCGFGLAFGLAAIDSSLKSVEQTESFLKLPVLGAIPQMKEVQAGSSQNIMGDPAQVMGAEAFRSLRTSLAMLGPGEERRTYLFTSAVPDEGKTFCTLNFAFSLAQQGLRTLLIDCDLRCPTIEEYLVGKPTDALGVADYLTGKADLSAIVQHSRSENFHFISAGRRCANPSELLAQTGIKELLDEALTRFDQVVIDSAPVHPVSDTLLLAHRVNAVCLVVRADRTPRKAASNALQKLQKSRANVVGFILNGISSLHRRDYYDYSDYYGRYRESATVEGGGQQR